jgi:hypothetical protein
MEVGEQPGEVEKRKFGRSERRSPKDQVNNKNKKG